jgi:hypothetical protein
MQIHLLKGKLAKVGSCVALAGMIAVLGGCRNDAVDIPNPTGPAELAIAILMTATPDIVVADGVSTSAIGLNVRDRNGRPIAGLRMLVLHVAGPGSIDRSFVTTDGNGMASVTYTTAAGGTGVVQVSARPIGEDFNGETYRNVYIEVLGPA